MSGSPFEQFAAFARERVPGMTDEELAPARRFRAAKASKGDYLTRVGDANPGSSFVMRGLVRLVIYGAGGRERVNGFASENALVCPYRAMLTRTTSDWSIQTLEPTWYLAIAPGVLPALARQSRRWRDFTTRLTEEKLVAAEFRTRTLLLDDATERYRSFLEQYAAIAERVPLAQVAAYVGVTPEALSRIRRRMFAAA
ncbi:MAG: Crp/Fnr family transcriptional regulator [Catenulispora sp.]|nr:Crp/Fnr family transcriptional regulator [Catenulispora sp.]